MVHARVPRLNCPTHGIKQLQVPWAEPGSQFTALFEVLAIDWLKQASVSAVAKHLRVSWDEASGVMERAVKRGLERREAEVMKYVGVDETSFAKRHEYVTLVTDLERPRVVYVADDRSQESLDGFWLSRTHEHLLAIEAVAMDMCAPYIQSTLLNVPFADNKIVFDKFHIAQNLGQAVDLVFEEPHGVPRGMLAVGIDDQDEGARRLANAGLDRRAVAFVIGMSNDACARGRGSGRRIVARSVVDHEDLVPRAGGAQIGDERPDRRRFVECRNDDRRRRARLPRRTRSFVPRLGDHVANRKLMMSPSCTMYSLPSSRTSPRSRQAAIDPPAIKSS